MIVEGQILTADGDIYNSTSESDFHQLHYPDQIKELQLPLVRIELTTPGLRDQCSASELRRLTL